MKWDDFVNKACFELSDGNEYFNFDGQFEKEQDLTQTIVFGLRKLFAISYGIKNDSKDLYHHIVYRQGDSDEDNIAWKKIKNDKWIFFHGARFVPDILMFRETDNSKYILPVEVKLITKPGSAQGIATSIGQTYIYNSRYPESISFVGIKRSIKWGKYKLVSTIKPSDKILHDTLLNNKIRLIMRDVG